MATNFMATNFMDNTTKIHLVLSGTVVVTGILALMFKWPSLISGLTILLTNIYLLAILFEATNRAAQATEIKDGILQPKPVRFFSFPAKAWLGVLILCIVVTTIFGFANMYISSGEVLYIGPNIDALAMTADAVSSAPPPTVLQDEIDGLYFSLVTMITLGYGEFVPVSSYARLLVIWQLATGGLLVIGVFPLIVSRVANF
jgi:Ion channel